MKQRKIGEIKIDNYNIAFLGDKVDFNRIIFKFASYAEDVKVKIT